MPGNRTFTPESEFLSFLVVSKLLITAPRTSDAVPNEEGKWALYTVSTYDLETHTEFTDVNLLDLETGSATRYSNNPKESSFCWLRGSSLLWQRESEKDKGTELWIGDADHETRPYLAGKIDAKLKDLRTKVLENGDLAFVFTAPVDANQNLYNTSKGDKPHTTAREWEYSRPRRWDSYVDQFRSAIWFTVLKFDGDTKKWHLSATGPINALRDTGLVVPLYSDSSSSADLSISTYGVIFAASEPRDTDWERTQRSIYFIPLSTFEETEVPALRKIRVPGHADLASAPTFAPKGPMAAFLVDQESEEWSYKTIAVVNVDTLKITALLQTIDPSDNSRHWDVFPDEILWSNDGSALYLTANDQALSRVFQVLLPPVAEDKHQTVSPVELEISGSVSSIYRLSERDSESRFLATSSSFIDQGLFSIVDPSIPSNTQSQRSKIIYSTSNHGSYFGISDKQVESITFPGGPDGRTPVQCWILKPSNYDPTSAEKYPFFLFMHGGPNSAVKDAWTWRWNAALLAEQGYIVAIPNFTGSDSFGQDFVRGVSLQWGGHPYRDLERCFNWVEENLSSKCDTSRAVAAGASYGGYMALYLEGQPLAKKIKAIVCHDGVFDVVSELLGDDLAQKEELTRSFGSPYFTDAPSADRDPPAAKELWRRWNPAEYLTNWSTPLLVIHSDRDFRCPSTAGWAAYAVCRLKGIETRLLNFPDENHFVLGRENSLVWWNTVIAWCNKFVGITDGPTLEPARSEPRWLGEAKPGRVLDVADV
ncbi:alpha/beta hydrolase family protein [Aspergillus homomorphus CBS 101889]|uniref:Dipeptidyl-peptidase V n=1 Tax=Aspergillus homomorphus (strain CBS 101889) TaxID=1450537 RepID=A0A395HS91_ASPHC|nr:alpha/beta-hydrolase [Aspergillus homomorphus CBS 101889]RAL09114.1 alpha/beta-hydrolase [Aspergillus homomorphus CBS 101889]